MTPRVAIVHDHIVQRGGAERVLLAMHRAFPEAAVYTAFYDPALTYPEFVRVDVRPLWINNVAPIRRRHRLSVALLPYLFSRLAVDADVVLCSSSGFAHGVSSKAPKVVYCHTPARWLYQGDRYLGRDASRLARATLSALRPALVGWDRRAAASAQIYLSNSTAVRERVRDCYQVEAEVLPAPPGLLKSGPATPLVELKPGFYLCISRLLPYKNVEAVIEAFAGRPERRLVVVGTGPLEGSLRRRAGSGVRFTSSVSDSELRWLYASCRGLVAASHEDYGLTPLEAAGFGKPVAALRWGGFLDTVVEGVTGVFFERPEASAIAAAVDRLESSRFDPVAVAATAERFSEARFRARLIAIVGRLSDSRPQSARRTLVS